jgi:diacylglycerol kinase (ATP)
VTTPEAPAPEAPDAAPTQETPRRLHRVPTIVQSLNFAFEGIIYVLRTQRNMRVHFALGALALIMALVLGVSKGELLALIVGISFVLIAEMLNTALEATIDIATSSFDPLAKVAKDVSAGAVLIAAVNAVGIAYLVFADRLANPSGRLIQRVRESPLNLSLITLILVIGIVITVKAISQTGTPLRGGLPSGHAAVAFAGWAAITFVTATYAHHLLISTLAFMMALLVAQTRVEAGIHSVLEVVYGGIVGTLVTLVVFQLWS